MAAPKDLPDVGGFIRDLRRNAKISLRQLAEQAGVSNPYLSQIERGLRKPSAEVLQQLASALRVSTPAMYLRAGLLDDKEGQGVLAAIAVDPDLTMAQKQSLSQIYETFRRENTRLAEATAAPSAPDQPTPTEPTEAAGVITPAATGPTTPAGTPTEAVLESVSVTEAGGASAPGAPAGTPTPGRAADPPVAGTRTTDAAPTTSNSRAAAAAEEELS
ncbi:helix-turn-helix domain-containing protein [Micromonospora sp. WMMD987]|uniref:helix-turn-helix domain-containing protein n=1 Tax=Micromonospora sp. WMMD987 TaxID=3016089 RepID=UPI00249CE387|nr:helix-turn-helix domain-containing protein [Micromonospora sp. WMMD987]WFE94993.1 helix-turn-helix domain-containing protein [Micromonospora sp. WMMD987]